jgi:hypothetical protein
MATGRIEHAQADLSKVDGAMQIFFQKEPHTYHALLKDELLAEYDNIIKVIEDALFKTMKNLAQMWLAEAYKQSQEQETKESGALSKMSAKIKACCQSMQTSTATWMPHAVEVAAFMERWFVLVNSKVFAKLSADCSAADISNTDVQALVRLGDVLRGEYTLQCFLQSPPELQMVRDWYSKSVASSATQRSEREKKCRMDSMRVVHDKAKELYEAIDQMKDDVQVSMPYKTHPHIVDAVDIIAVIFIVITTS